MLFSFIYLSYRETQLANIENQNLWMLYFENPKNNSLNFAIENHSQSTNFHWKISLEKDEIKNGDIAINQGQTKIIPVNTPQIENKKITITITDSENKVKEIYKIIDNQ